MRNLKDDDNLNMNKKSIFLNWTNFLFVSRKDALIVELNMTYSFYCTR